MKMLMGMVTTIQELMLPSFASDIAVVFFVMCDESSDDFECSGRAGFNRGHHCLTIASPEGFEHSFLLHHLDERWARPERGKVKAQLNSLSTPKVVFNFRKNMSLVAFTRRCFLQLCSPLAKWSVEQDRRLQMGDHSYSRLPL